MLNFRVNSASRADYASHLLASWALLRACYAGDDLVKYQMRNASSQSEADEAGINYEIDHGTPLASLLDYMQQFTPSNPSQSKLDVLNQDVTVEALAEESLDDADPSNKPTITLEAYEGAILLRVKDELAILHEKNAVSIAQDLQHVLAQVLGADPRTQTSSNISFMNSSHLDRIWQWNATVPEPVTLCVHELVEEAIRRNPSAAAIHAWDGELTYGQLDQMAATLANLLVTAGLLPGQAVPLCFEKSKWMPVSALAVMRAGGACISLDPQQPEERLRTIIQQVNPPVVLSSISQQHLASTIASESRIIVPEQAQDHTAQNQTSQNALPQVDPASPAYIVFTSGSTGTPKGAIVSHGNFCSAVRHQQAALGISSDSRIYDFVSYAFDVSWSNVLHALTAGACLCIPSEHDRQNRIAASVRDLRVNFAHITPTVGRLMAAQSAELRIDTVAFIGEPLLPSDVAHWAPRSTLLLNTYGPAEATPVSTIADLQHCTAEPSIGTAVGCNTWVVGRGDELAPIGAVGELVIEGPIVGQGYLNDPIKTGASFIQDSAWLVRGGGQSGGRTGRLYRTGDMVRYKPDGSLVFIGRRDGQVKIHGQRVELGDIESHLHDVLTTVVAAQSAVEIVVPKGSDSKMITAFVVASRDSLAEVARRVTAALSRQLPQHMLPTAWLALDELPMTASGKLDRRKLRAMGGDLTAQQLVSTVQSQTPAEEPETEQENVLQKLWAGLTGLPASLIGRNTSFMQIGGDSMKAIQLVSAARTEGLSISVADIIKATSLKEMAASCGRIAEAGKKDPDIAPFSKWGGPTSPFAEGIQSMIARACNVARVEIEDALPCTPLQEGMLALTARRPKVYRATNVFELSPSVNSHQLEHALDMVITQTPILRTRVVDIGESQFIQAVVAPSHKMVRIVEAELKDCLAADEETPYTFGMELLRPYIVSDAMSRKRFLVLSLHHSLYDGLSFPIVLRRLESAYGDGKLENLADFRRFVYEAVMLDLDAAGSFWNSHFKGIEAETFPQLSSPKYEPAANRFTEYSMSSLAWPTSNFTPTTIIRTAWALLQDQYTASNGDVLFGNVVTGRQAPIAHIENMCGPTMATTPMRLQIDGDMVLQDLLQQVQTIGLEMIPFEQIGLQRLRKISTSCARGCEFQSLLVVQPQQQYTQFSNKLFSRTLMNDEENLITDEEMLHRFNPVALLLQFHLVQNGLRIKFSYDSEVIGGAQISRMGAQLEHVVRQICNLLSCGSSAAVRHIERMSPQDCTDVWRWNAQVPVTVSSCMHEIIGNQARLFPEATAIQSWDGTLTYRDLDQLSTHLAQQLVALHVCVGDSVALCFEKSKWTAVSVLAVMKAGAASVTFDVHQPDGRLRSMLRSSNATILLCSQTQEIRSRSLVQGSHVQVAISEHLCSNSKDTTAAQCVLPTVDPSDRLYIVYTSGSTGEPKGAITSHANFASAVFHQQKTVGLNRQSRVLDLVSYAFDVSKWNMLHTLAAGACLCIPSDDQRDIDLDAAIHDLRANFVHITPTMARLIDPAKVPGLATVILTGEPISENDFGAWKDRKVLNTYGPCECTINATCYNFDSHTPDLSCIGTGFGQNTWVVDAADHTQLAAIGAAGELLLEGPLVGYGYVNDQIKTDSTYVKAPKWLQAGNGAKDGRGSVIYRTGDLVRYKEDGSLTFLGRRDGQVKIRGQRIELSEIDAIMLKHLKGYTTVAEVVQPLGNDSKTIVAFVTRPGIELLTDDERDSTILPDTQGLREKLKDDLPGYMVPTGIVSMAKMPTTASGKVDRRALRELGASLNEARLNKLYDEKQDSTTVFDGPKTAVEAKLQELIAAVLSKTSPAQVNLDQSFVRLGGDSLVAIRFVTVAKKAGIMLTVTNVFKTKTIRDLAKTAKTAEQARSTASDELLPFALLPQNLDLSKVRSEAGDACDIHPERVEDIYPCTALQEGLMALSSKYPDKYVSRDVITLRPGLDIDRVQQAWESVVASLPILRTRLVHLSGLGLSQVVVKNGVQVTTGQQLDEYLQNDQDSPLLPGGTLMRVALVKNKEHLPLIVWTIHHALYDIWTMPSILKRVEEAYQQTTSPSLVPFARFVQYVKSLHPEAVEAFWTQYLRDLDAETFPRLPSAKYDPQPNATANFSFRGIDWQDAAVTPAALIRASWGFLIAKHANSSDAVFGALSIGRQAAVEGIDRIAGPTIATVPVRVNVAQTRTVADFLAALQSDAADMIDFEQVGVQTIRKAGPHGEAACAFQSLVVIQPSDSSSGEESSPIFEAMSGFQDQADGFGRGYSAFNVYAIMLVISVRDDGLDIRVSYDSNVVEETRVTRLMRQLEHILQQMSLAENQTRPLQDIRCLSLSDMAFISRWNTDPIAPVAGLMHDLISQVAERQPLAIAVEAWDGIFTYDELERHSRKLALLLKDQGVVPNTYIPLCFEKSKWTPVAMLAVMKTGAAAILLDPALPESRLSQMISQCEPTHLVCSSNMAKLARKIGHERMLLMLPEVLEQTTPSNASLPEVSPQATAYCAFTSGSTGTPKGVRVSHLNFVSAVEYQRSATGLSAGARVYDFSSYSFDAAWFNALHTFANGGVLCIPSDDERKSDLEKSMARFGTTSAVLTPSTARLLRPENIPTLKNLLLAGEPITRKDIEAWATSVILRIAYGPAECSVMATGYDCHGTMQQQSGSIGKAIGTVAWVVDPRSRDKLAPVGAVGELWLEGPLVSQGYLQEAETLKSFAKEVPWLREMSGVSASGERGPFYKTGDMVRYNEDGSLQFVGRVDQQVKLRGQRVELGEVEHHISGALQELDRPGQVIVDVIQPRDESKQTLVAYITSAEIASAPAAERQELLNGYSNKLHELLVPVLPSYELPSSYIALDRIPVTSTGKVDRRALKDYGMSLSRDDMAKMHATARKQFKEVSTQQEMQMRSLWAEALEIEAAEISANDSFLQIGGDSIRAMRLVSTARHHGFALSVADVFKRPQLEHMAAQTQKANHEVDMKYIEPFSLMKGVSKQDQTVLIDTVAKICRVSRHDIVDVFPCTPLQEGMLALTARRDNDYVSTNILRIRDDIDVGRFRRAFERVVDKTSILRTRIVETEQQGLCQVVVKPQQLTWFDWTSVADFKQSQQSKITMGMGTALHQHGLIRDQERGCYHFVWNMHHALYDGFSFPLLLESLDAALFMSPMPQVTDFQHFVKHTLKPGDDESAAFWKGQFQDLDAPSYPSLPTSDYQPHADDTIKRVISGIAWPSTDITASSAVRAAWSLMISRLTDSEDVVFGAVVSGRQASLAGIERVVGPTIATVPVRVKVQQSNNSVESFLSAVQAQAADMVPYEQMGLQNIRKLGEDAQQACNFQSLLVVQPQKGSDVGQKIFDVSDGKTNPLEDEELFNTYAILLHCQLQESGLLLHVNFDSKVVQRSQALRISSQFEALLQRMCDPLNQQKKLAHVRATCLEDMQDIWGWNKNVPETIERCIHDIIAETTARQPDALAIDAWDGSLTYGQLAAQSDYFAKYLVSELQLQPGEVVPLCFEKSVWMAVAVHGVMKAGCASISMDSTQPEERLRVIVEQASPKVIIASRRNEALAGRLVSAAKARIAVPEVAIARNLPLDNIKLPKVSPSDKLYVVFTSGSTGVPKGVTMCHSSFASASYHQRHQMRIGPGSRVYDFVSYSFDFAWSNALNTLCMGGCLCVPSEDERKSNLNESLRETRTTFVHLTASVVKVLDTDRLPDLQALALGGERMDKSFIRAWDPSKRLLNFYGPAECAQTVSITDFDPATADPSDISRSIGINGWLVEPSNPSQLAMVGAVAELCLEGPMIARGYLSELDNNVRGSPFQSDPAWLLEGSGSGVPGRTSRIYRTGDLVRYNPDGSLVFLGRKDNRVKIRGQRVELPEVEYHIKTLLADHGELQIVADLITPRVAEGQKSNVMLVAFMNDPSGRKSAAELQNLSVGLDERLASLVPIYMVPSIYIPMEKIPMGGTGKVDRKKLRSLGGEMTLEQLAAMSPDRAKSRVPETEAEKQMALLWADILKVDVNTIRAEDSFFRIGGDSIGVMRLVGMLKRKDQEVTVAEVFMHPKLSELVNVVRHISHPEKPAETVTRFSLLSKKKKQMTARR